MRWPLKLVTVLCLLLTLAGRARCADPTLSEYQVKAAFLNSFTRFVEWPANAFSDSTDPLQIAVLGTDPFGAALDEAVQGKIANGRPIVLRRVTDVSALQRSQLVFISASERKRVLQIVAALAGRSVLTVADMDPADCRGVMIVMAVGADDKVKLAINEDAAVRAELTISSRLLRLAEIIRD
jgi:hypothetical protein